MIWPRSVYDMIWLWYDMWMMDVYILWYDMGWYVINWHAYDMNIVMRYVMAWYVYDENYYAWKHEMLWLWYTYVIWMIWYDWHAKQRTSMKYDPSVCMKDMISDMKNDMGCTEC